MFCTMRITSKYKNKYTVCYIPQDVLVRCSESIRRELYGLLDSKIFFIGSINPSQRTFGIAYNIFSLIAFLSIKAQHNETQV